MAWKYCQCVRELPRSTLREDVADGQVCPSCLQFQPPERSTAEVLYVLLERIEALEGKQ